jgi:multiple sugar transport system permease protein
VSRASRARHVLAAAAFAAFFLGPFAWQALTSLWPERELGRAWPSTLTLANYGELLRDRDFMRAALNSVVVAAGTTALALAVAAPAAFAAAKLEFRGRRALLGVALAVTMFPPIATVSPLYVILRAIGLLDRLGGLVLPYATFALPLALWLLTTTFRSIPGEIYRAALADGCTPFQAFRWVLLPLAAPGLATAAILVFISAWNELLFALTFIATPSRRTVPVAIALFSGEHLEPWGQIAAASMLATLPLAVLTFAFQRRIVSGLTAGAVKG